MFCKVAKIITNEQVCVSLYNIKPSFPHYIQYMYNFNEQKLHLSVVHTHVDTFLCALWGYLYFIVEFNLPGTKFMVKSIRPSTFARIIYARAIAAW